MRLSRQEKQLLVNLLDENKKKLSHNSLSQMGGQLLYESDWVMQSLSCIGVLVSLTVLQDRRPIFLPIKASVRI